MPLMHVKGSRFWIAGTLAVAAMVAALAVVYDRHGRSQLLANEARSSVRLTLALASLAWPQPALNAATPDNGPARPRWGSDLAAAMHHALTELPPRLQADIHAASGLTIFSTDPSRIGRQIDADEGFRRAVAGQISSELHQAPDRRRGGQSATVSTRVPIGRDGAVLEDGESGPAALILEVHSDVGPELAAHQRRVAGVAGFGALALLLSLLALDLLLRLADGRVAAAERARREQQEAARLDSLRDPLTGLPNRSAFAQWIGEPSVRASEAIQFIAIDLDRFKLLNDSLGQAIGDRILCEASARIGSAIGAALLFRLGGNEFMAALARRDPAQGRQLGQAVIETFRRPLEIDGVAVALTASVGLARWPADHPDPEQVARCADLASLAAKRAGSQRMTEYQPAMRAEVDAEVALMNGLRRAAQLEQFELHYQPRLNGHTLQIECVEALLRWNHPEQGLLLPARFIHALEDSPLIVEVGHWVLKTACEQAVFWHHHGLQDLRVSVNVAARQFDHDGFVDSVSQVLTETGLPADMLELELTESQLISNAESALQRINDLKALGIKLSIDDFGTGYSALSYLQRLPIDGLKIDRSFVKEVHRAEDGQIARAIAALAHSLGLSVVAEGVETEAQAEAARHWGCEQLQGFLYSPPVATEQVPELFRRVQRRLTATSASAVGLPA